jgi:hypothetical protein
MYLIKHVHIQHVSVIGIRHFAFFCLTQLFQMPILKATPLKTQFDDISSCPEESVLSVFARFSRFVVE